MTITAEDIRQAARAIEGTISRTPFLQSKTLSELLGADIRLKLEMFQFTASFKERGALNKILSLTEAERAAGVIAMSAGNHAQAVAYHATRLGIAATIVMPEATPFVKVANTEALGAKVVLAGKTLSDAADRAEAMQAEHALTFIHPYDDPLIIAGQGTVALEMLDETPDLDIIVVPIGGGGLMSGCAVAARAIKPDIRMIGVEAALYPAMKQTLAGEPVAAGGLTIAEGIAVKDPGHLTREIIEREVEEIVLVEEGDIERGVQLIAEIEKVVAEGAAGAALAGVLAHPDLFANKTVGLVLGGGNVDSRILSQMLMRGLARAGRMARLRVQIGDVPGSLAKVTELIGSFDGNIVDVEHERWFFDVPVRMTAVDMLIEVRRLEDALRIADGLTEAGYPARLMSGRSESEGY